MILLVESGSSKTDWALVSNHQISYFSGEGLNPSTLSENTIVQRIEKLKESIAQSPDKIYHYGAGCAADPAKQKLKEIYQRIFSKPEVMIETDLLAAARASCNGKAGFVCILGTGSHAAFSDGIQILHAYPSLGYILGDLGSATHIAKRFLQQYYSNGFDADIMQLIHTELQILDGNFIFHFYQSTDQQKILSSVAHFVITHRDLPAFRLIVKQCFKEFIQIQFTNRKHSQEYPVHVVGSVGFLLKDQFLECLSESNLLAGNILKNPLEGLITFHLNYEIH